MLAPYNSFSFRETADRQMGSPDSRHWAEPPGWWRRTRPLRWLVVLGVLAYVVHAAGVLEQFGLTRERVETFLAPEPHPELAGYTGLAEGVQIAERFTSYQDVDSAIAILEGAGFSNPKKTFRKAEESSAYPPYRFDTVEVDSYRHLGEAGQLKLEFFNDRLFQAEFVPKDPVDYARRQRALGLSRDRNARREKIEGHQRIVSTVDLAVSDVGIHLRTEPFILWQDLRLVAQRDKWDQKFGTIPKSMVSS